MKKEKSPAARLAPTISAPPEAGKRKAPLIPKAAIGGPGVKLVPLDQVKVPSDPPAK